MYAPARPSLRHRLAGPWRLANRLLPRPKGVRLLLLHDTPADRLEALDRLVGWLAKAGRLATPEEAEATIAGAPPATGPERCVLTFDDGFASNLPAAEQVLARHGAKAMFFVCPGLLALPPEQQPAAIAARVFDGKRDAPGLGLMGWQHLERLAGLGHVIGSHTMDHRRLTTLSPDERAEQVGRAAEILKARLGRCDWFAYPFGDIASIDAASLEEVARHHRFCRSGVRGANLPGTDTLAITADEIDLASPLSYQKLTVEGGLDFRYAEARRRLNGLLEA
jgi:peptidoglycan/xylan/chitin deacetylase (PgdA/CDA1 family)